MSNPLVDERALSQTADALEEVGKTTGRSDIAVVCLYAAAVLRSLVANVCASDDWEPTADNINALPKPIRAYIQDLTRGLGPPM